MHPISPLFFVSVLCFLFAICTSFAPAPIGLLRPSDENTGDIDAGICNGGVAFWRDQTYCVCPRRTICADSWVRILFLGLARGSAYLDYPLYVSLFLSKANSLCTALDSTALSLYVPFNDLHRIHTFAGLFVGIEVCSHSFWHLLRWSTREDDIELLWTTVTGRTGLLSLILTPFIVLPMAWGPVKKRMRWEWRKGLHYLSAVWALSICFHAPRTHIFYIIGCALLVYVTDWLYSYFFRTHLVQSTYFRRLDAACEMTFENPKDFKLTRPGFVLVCLPWVSKHQWHAFSVFPHKTKPDWSSVCMAAGGDWTKTLHKTIVQPTARPAWILGPIASPYSTSINADKIIAIASGIGITPAISLVNFYSDTRCINLVWICREPGLIEHYVREFATVFTHSERSWALIYYTGRARKLVLDSAADNILVLKGRPDLKTVIPVLCLSIEDRIESDVLLESLFLTHEVCTTIPEDTESRLHQELARVFATYTPNEIFDVAYGKLHNSVCGSRQTSKVSFGGSHQINGFESIVHHASGRASRASSVVSRGDESIVNGQEVVVSLSQESYPSAQTASDCHALRRQLSAPSDDTTIRRRGQRAGNRKLKSLEDNGVRRHIDPFMLSHALGELAYGDRSKITLLDLEKLCGQAECQLDSEMDCAALEACITNIRDFVSGGRLRMKRTQSNVSGISVNSELVDHELRDFAVGNKSQISSDWQLLYCGGSIHVENELKQISKTYNVPLEVERFDW